MFSLRLFRQRKAAKDFCYQRFSNAFSFEERGPKEKALQKENAVFAYAASAATRRAPLLKKWTKQYTIDFTVDLEIDKYEAYAVDIHVLIYKGEEFIGWLPVTLEGNEFRDDDSSQYSVFPSNKKHTMKFSFLGGRNLQNADPLFKELYNGKINDYTFVTKLVGVGFIDGTDVGFMYMDSMDYTYNTEGEIEYDDYYLQKKGYWWK